MLITTKGEFTTKGFDSCCDYANNIDEAFIIIKKILLRDELYFRQKQLDICNFLENDLPESWEEVATSYFNFLCK